MRLIDADELIEIAHRIRLDSRERIERMIESAPTVDAAEVVRCKDCRWGREACGNIECSTDLNLPPEYHGYNWFCPNGEREKDGVL